MIVVAYWLHDTVEIPLKYATVHNIQKLPCSEGMEAFVFFNGRVLEP